MAPELALLFDWETTGLTLHPDADRNKQPRAIEFGGILVELAPGCRIVEEASILIDPGVSLPPEIVKITGLTDADLEGAPNFVGALPQLRRLFAEATVIVAHNLPFDRSILRYELERAGITDFPWPARELCTVGLYRDDWGRNPKLLELYQHVLGRPLAQTHRALDDVRALLEIFVEQQLWELA